MKVLNEYLKVNIKQREARGRFKLIEFQDIGHFVTLIPSLNLSAYGDTKADSRKMMGDIVLKDYFDHLMALTESRIFEELKNLGWDRSPFYKEELSKDVHIDREGILKNFNLSETTILEETLIEA